MKKIIILLMLTFCVSISFAQYTPMTAAGYQFKRILCDSTLHIPSFCGIPTLRNSTAKNGAIAMDTCNGKFYMWTNAIGWGQITGVGTDTTSLSQRIDQRVKYTDTASMLLAYLRKQDTANKWVSNVTRVNDTTIRVYKGNTITDLKILGKGTDTTSLSSRIDARVKYTDTASMLLPYLRKADTSAMLSKYLRKTDTASLSNRINLKVNISDTATMLSKYLRKTDTASLSNRINLKVNISDTATMLSKYLRKTDTANKWVSNVTKKNDSTITIFKGTTSTDITLPRGSGGGGSTPTLQEVTTAGATTNDVINLNDNIAGIWHSNLNTIEAPVSNMIYYPLKWSDEYSSGFGYIKSFDISTGNNLPEFLMGSSGGSQSQVKLNTNEVSWGYSTQVSLIPYEIGNNPGQNYTLRLPIYDGLIAKDTLATLKDLRSGTATTPNLQQVTDVNNVTTNTITVGEYIGITNPSNNYVTTLTATSTATRNIDLPNNSGTMVLSVNGETALDDGNITLAVIGGTGTKNYIPKFSNSNTLTNSLIADSSSTLYFTNNSMLFDYPSSVSRMYSTSKMNLQSATTSGDRLILGTIGGNTAATTNEVVHELGDISATSGTKINTLLRGHLLHGSGSQEVDFLKIAPDFNQSGSPTTTTRGVYYAPNFSTSYTGKNIAFQSTSGDVILNNLKTSTSTTDSIAIFINDTLKKAAYPKLTSTGRFGNDTANVVMAKVHNNSGVALTNGKVVFMATSGTNSDAPSVRLANNKADSTSANTFGFVSGTIAVNDTGWIILSGKIEKLNTSAFANGDIIYLDSVSGEWTKTKPVAPYHMVYLGVVVKANNGNGSIFVKCQNGYELDEIHDVKITSPQNNDVLSYETSTKLWKNKAIIDTTTVYLLSDFGTTNLTATNTPLSFSIGANEVRRIMINGTCTKSASTGGLKVAIGAPTGATFKGVMNASTNAISTQVFLIPNAVNTLYPTASAINTAAATEMPFRIEGIITNGSTAGTVYLQVASVTSNTATINAGTLMSWGKVKGQ